MDLGLIRKVDIDAEMQQSYLDYAMSVIVARALPDARDGLKPVQRRILYAMYDMGLRADTAYKKSARIVGEVLGKYHPHGDMAVYEAMARMAQDFSMRYPLVDGQGNFGSVDGDPPAAMRYTEARLASPAIDMISQIDKNTVDFVANFDDTLREPVVLPAAIPNLLVNGATGIAVGMATNIPPHNLSEVVDASIYMLDQWEKLDDIPVEDFMKFIQGPDFPTGGLIIQDPQADGLASAYGTGRGRVIVRARAHLEEMGRGRNRIIVTELPYMTNKASLIERIAELVRDGKLEGITDLRDESDRQGMRIVIELSKTAEADKLLRQLYQHTPMQTTFGITLLALVDGEPRTLSLKQALRVYLEHRLVVVRRRSEYDLERARQRAHILEGLRIALANLDEIVKLIRNSPDVDQARKRLMTSFKLSEVQAQAILDMPLRRLAALERKKIEQEYKEVTELIKNLEALLRSPKKMREVVIDELRAVREAYGDRRRTQIVRLKEGSTVASLLTTTDVTPEQVVWVGVTQDGRIGRSPDEKLPEWTGEGAPRWLLQTNTHQTLFLAGESGKAAAVAIHALPMTTNLANGAPVDRISPLSGNDFLASIFSFSTSNGDDLDNRYILTVSRGGMVKKTALSELPGPSAQAFTLVKVNDGDALGWAVVTGGEDELLLTTANGMGIRFKEGEVRSMGLAAVGVGGIRLAVGDMLTGVELLQAGNLPPEILLVTSDGKAKRVPLKEFPIQSRYGQGVIAWKPAKGVQLSAVLTVRPSDQILVHLEGGASQVVSAKEAPLTTRANQGKVFVALAKEVGIYALTPYGSPTPAAQPVEPTAPAKKRAAPAARGDGTARGDGAARSDGAATVKAAAKASKSAAAKAETKPAAKPAAKPAKDGSKAGKASQPALIPIEPASADGGKKSTAKPAAAKPPASKGAPAKAEAKAAPAKTTGKAAPKSTAEKPPSAKPSAKPAAETTKPAKTNTRKSGSTARPETPAKPAAKKKSG